VTILIVDDDDDLREAFVEYLEMQGHEVYSARDGFDAINLSRKKRFDFVFSDINMPRCDGWTVARMIKKQQPETRIYLCTGSSQAMHCDWAKTEEIEAIFAKPMNLEQIMKLLEAPKKAATGG